MKAIIVRPYQEPVVEEIGETLKDMQTVVNGRIEEIMPFEDEIALICNEEGKVRGLPLNRAIFAENGQLLDIIAGTFFLCYAPIESETFASVPEDLMNKYIDMFSL